MKQALTTTAETCGAAAITYGTWQISHGFGWIVGGILTIALSVLVSR